MAPEMVLKAAQWKGAELKDAELKAVKLKVVELKAAKSQLLLMGKDVIEEYVMDFNESLR